jgi:hypothetical protein
MGSIGHQQNMAKTVNEHRIETLSRTLSDRTGLYLVESDIVRLETSKNSKLKVGPCPGQVRHCPVGDLWKT